MKLLAAIITAGFLLTGCGSTGSAKLVEYEKCLENELRDSNLPQSDWTDNRGITKHYYYGVTPFEKVLESCADYRP